MLLTVALVSVLLILGGGCDRDYRRTIQAYKCNTNGIYDETGTIPDAVCIGNKQDQGKPEIQNFKLIKRLARSKFIGIHCKIRGYLKIQYCGDGESSEFRWLWVKVPGYNGLKIYLHNFTLEREDCLQFFYNQTLVLRNMSYFGGSNDKIEIKTLGHEDSLQIFLAGKQYLRTKISFPDDNYCDKGKFELFGQKYESHTLSLNLHVFTEQIDLGYDFESKFLFFKHKKIRNILIHQNSIKHEDIGTLAFDKINFTDQFKIIDFKHINTTRLDKNIFILTKNNSKDKFVVKRGTLIKFRSDIQLYKTNYRNIYVCKICLAKIRELQPTLENSILDLKIFHTSKFYTLNRFDKNNLLNVKRELCHLNTKLYSLRYNSEASSNKFLKEEGRKQIYKGDVVYTQMCDPVLVEIDKDDNNCYTNLAVLYEGKKYFLEKESFILLNKTKKVKCSNFLKQKFLIKDKDGKYSFVCEPPFYDTDLCKQPKTDSKIIGMEGGKEIWSDSLLFNAQDFEDFTKKRALFDITADTFFDKTTIKNRSYEDTIKSISKHQEPGLSEEYLNYLYHSAERGMKKIYSKDYSRQIKLWAGINCLLYFAGILILLLPERNEIRKKKCISLIKLVTALFLPGAWLVYLTDRGLDSGERRRGGATKRQEQ